MYNAGHVFGLQGHVVIISEYEHGSATKHISEYEHGSATKQMRSDLTFIILITSKMIYHGGEPEQACIAVLSWHTNHG